MTRDQRITTETNDLVKLPHLHADMTPHPRHTIDVNSREDLDNGLRRYRCSCGETITLRVGQ